MGIVLVTLLGFCGGSSLGEGKSGGPSTPVVIMIVFFIVIAALWIVYAIGMFTGGESSLEGTIGKNAEMFRNLRRKIKSRLESQLGLRYLWSDKDIINAEAEALKNRLVESSKRVFAVLRPLMGALAKVVLKMQAAGKKLVTEGEMEEISSAIAEVSKQGLLVVEQKKAAAFKEAAKSSVEKAVEGLSRAQARKAKGHAGYYKSFGQYLQDLHNRVEAELRSHYSVEKHRMVTRATMPTIVSSRPRNTFWRQKDYEQMGYGPGYRETEYSYDYGYGQNLEVKLANLEHEQAYFEDFLKQAFAALEEGFGSFAEEEQEAMLYLLNGGDKRLLRAVASVMFPGLGWDSWWGSVGLV